MREPIYGDERCRLSSSLLKLSDFYSRISETLSLNKYVAIRRDSSAKLVIVRQNTTLLGYCRKKYVGAKIRKTNFRSNSRTARNEILIFVTWETVLQTLFTIRKRSNDVSEIFMEKMKKQSE